jgi:hypothetical protein
MRVHPIAFRLGLAVTPGFALTARAEYDVTVLQSLTRKSYEGLQSLRNMRRMDAKRRNMRAVKLRFSQSLANLRQRLSQAIVRSTIQRLGSEALPLILNDSGD